MVQTTAQTLRRKLLESDCSGRKRKAVEAPSDREGQDTSAGRDLNSDTVRVRLDLKRKG